MDPIYYRERNKEIRTTQYERSREKLPMENKVKRREQLKVYKVGNKYKDISKRVGEKKRIPEQEKLFIRGGYRT